MELPLQARRLRLLLIISIIVPVYNMELYLKRCLESLLMQSYKNIEIILVDDGSKDASGAIVKQVYSENEEKGEEVLTDIEESLMLRSIGEDGEELAISAIETLSERVIDDILAQNEVEEK